MSTSASTCCEHGSYLLLRTYGVLPRLLYGTPVIRDTLYVPVGVFRVRGAHGFPWIPLLDWWADRGGLTFKVKFVMGGGGGEAKALF